MRPLPQCCVISLLAAKCKQVQGERYEWYFQSSRQVLGGAALTENIVGHACVGFARELQ